MFENISDTQYAREIQSLQKDVATLKKHTKMTSFLTEYAFNYAKSKSLSNVVAELKESDYIESLVHLFSEKIVTQMYEEFK